MEELDRSKKDFEKIIQAKNKELERTKVWDGGQRLKLSACGSAWHSLEGAVAVAKTESCSLPQGANLLSYSPHNMLTVRQRPSSSLLRS